MQKTKAMDLNRETAMRLWTKSFGKENKVKDYTGRTIAKGAYNDRNSEYGWNLDHILPQSRGGKTADYNLICCHILTNDEKADKFPGFKANGITFEIVKVENHYEIQQVSANKKKKTKEEDSSKVNFMDSASGIRFFKKLKGVQNKQVFVGTVHIELKNLQTTALVDFINELFENGNSECSIKRAFDGNDAQIDIKYSSLRYKEDMQVVLDNCVILNTYLRNYFKSIKVIDGYDIQYSIEHFDDKWDEYNESSPRGLVTNVPGFYSILDRNYGDTLYISELVILNTDASEKVTPNRRGKYTEFDYVYTRLEQNLEKEVSGK